MILHLVPADVWADLDGSVEYAPESLFTEGFVHCTDGDELMLDIANRFYRDLDEALVLTIDEHMLHSEIRYEPPAPLPPDWNGEPLFPHVYGPLELDAVVLVRRLLRGADGRYVGYANE